MVNESIFGRYSHWWGILHESKIDHFNKVDFMLSTAHINKSSMFLPCADGCGSLFSILHLEVKCVYK